MKKLISILVISIGVLAALYFGYSHLVLLSVPVPDREEVWVAENLVIHDSTQVVGSPKAYVFCYDTGAFGYSTNMVSIDVPTHTSALLSSDYITNLEWISDDTLKIELSESNYKILNKENDIHVLLDVISLSH